VSYETADAAGHEAIALGNFQAADDVRENTCKVLTRHWEERHLMDGSTRWTALPTTGLLGRTDADLMAEGVWG